MNAPSQVFNSLELAREFRVSGALITKWKEKGLPYTIAGRECLYDLGEVQKWLCSNGYSLPVGKVRLHAKSRPALIARIQELEETLKAVKGYWKVWNDGIIEDIPDSESYTAFENLNLILND